MNAKEWLLLTTVLVAVLLLCAVLFAQVVHALTVGLCTFLAWLAVSP